MATGKDNGNGNVDVVKIENGRLIMDVALDKTGRPSASGKTTVYYSTGSPPAKVGDYTLAATLYRK